MSNETEKKVGESTPDQLDKTLDRIKKIRDTFPKKKIVPVVIKVTVTNGQARVNLPKHIALKLSLLNAYGEPGKVRYLLVNSHRSGISLAPVEMTEVEN
ncbi:hypothetical protein ES703_36776 [subsurface metagenome]